MKISRLALAVLPVAIIVALAGCGADNGSAPTPAAGLVATPVGELTRADTGRAQAQRADWLEAAAAANNAFGVALFDQLTEATDGNLFLSPFSVSQALAMTYAGAEGETAEQMADALALADLASDSVHGALGALDRSLARESEGDDDDSERTFRLAIANALWVEATYGVEPEFLDTLARGYGAGVRGVDFINESDASREQINAWVADETDDRIEELLPAGSIDDLTRLVIANAIHFDAAWRQTFDRIGEATFNRLDGSTEPVEMMSRRGPTPFGEGDGYKAAELTYRGGAYSMLLIVPDEGEYERVEARMGDGLLAEAVGTPRDEADVALELPPFEFRSELELEEPLEALGMVDAFDPEQADFTAINPEAREHGLHVSDVFHDAFVRVDEEGTEAAAATGAVIGIVSAPRHSLTVDRPFLFAIRDRESGAVLFLGRVLDPGDQPS